MGVCCFDVHLRGVISGKTINMCIRAKSVIGGTYR